VTFHVSCIVITIYSVLPPVLFHSRRCTFAQTNMATAFAFVPRSVDRKIWVVLSDPENWPKWTIDLEQEYLAEWVQAQRIMPLHKIRCHHLVNNMKRMIHREGEEHGTWRAHLANIACLYGQVIYIRSSISLSKATLHDTWTIVLRLTHCWWS
jgi:hypothetical protein